MSKIKSKSLGTRYGAYRRSARRRSFAFTITKTQFENISRRPCKYCGNFNGTDPDENPYNGIDRVDNTKGYIKGNCVPCCWICNSLKGHGDEIEFLEHIKAIYEYQKRNK